MRSGWGTPAGAHAPNARTSRATGDRSSSAYCPSFRTQTVAASNPGRFRPLPDTTTELQELLDQFRIWYNTARPHRAIARTTPATAYAATPKATPNTETTPEWRTRMAHPHRRDRRLGKSQPALRRDTTSPGHGPSPHR
ncbi:integrase core domain-containing protein [Kocuria sp. WRN011]|uniref:integrase core domain-containing protein n=1 Tax=Kocuria sp. WRN011 TaxID=2029858 RepID=UPI00117999F2